MPWRRILSARTLENSNPLSVKIDDKIILITKIGDKIYGLDAICTHARCILGHVDFNKKIVKCPSHNATYDLETGSMIEAPSVAPNFPKEKGGLKTFNIRIEEGWIEVEI